MSIIRSDIIIDIDFIYIIDINILIFICTRDHIVLIGKIQVMNLINQCTVQVSKLKEAFCLAFFYKLVMANTITAIINIILIIIIFPTNYPTI